VEEEMNGKPEYRRFQFGIADLLAVMVIVAVLGATSRLPVSLFHIIPLLAVLYVVRYRILTLRVRPWLALLLYFVVVVALLPYLYCCIYVPWHSYSEASPLAGWIGGPIDAFAIPTAFYFYDVLAHKLPSLKFYAVRSLLEIVILFPLWDFVWQVIELFLGWIWV
jgi:hypothetical protein